MRDKQIAINKACSDYLKKYLQNNIIASILENKESTIDPYIDKELDKIKAEMPARKQLNFGKKN